MASKGLRRCVFDGSIPAIDSEIHKRPYHKNCSCALHHRPGKCKKECTHGKTSISYKTRKAWSESCLVAASGCWSTSYLPVKKVVWES